MPKSLDHCQPAPSAVRLLEQCLLHRDLFSEPRTAQACRRAIDWIPPDTPDMASGEQALSPRSEQDPIDLTSSRPPMPEPLATRSLPAPTAAALYWPRHLAALGFLCQDRWERRSARRLKPASFVRSGCSDDFVS